MIAHAKKRRAFIGLTWFVSITFVLCPLPRTFCHKERAVAREKSLRLVDRSVVLY